MGNTTSATAPQRHHNSQPGAAYYVSGINGGSGEGDESPYSSLTASPKALLARKFSMSSFRSSASLNGSPTHSNTVLPPITTTTATHGKQSHQQENEGTDAYSTSSPLSPLSKRFSFLGSFFSGNEQPNPSSPPKIDMNSSSSPIDRRNDDLGSSPGRKEFRRWVESLDSKLLWGYAGSGSDPPDQQGGIMLLKAVKKQLAKQRCEELIFECNLTKQEAASLAILSSRTGIGELARQIIESNFEDKRNSFSANELRMPSLVGHRDHGVFFEHLLSGLPKLPVLHGQEYSKSSTATSITFCCLELSAIEKHNDFYSNITLPTLLSVSTVLPEAICTALGGPHRCRILCIKSSHVRTLRALNMSMDPSIDLGVEGVLLPGWQGTVVGSVPNKWKTIVSAVFGWDVTPYTLMEIVESNTDLGGTGDPGDLSPRDAASSSPRNLQRLVKKVVAASSPRKLRGAAVSFPPSTAVVTTSAPPFMQPFMAKEYLVFHVQRILTQHPKDVTWNMYMGLLQVYAVQNYINAKHCFELVLKEKTADYAASLQLGMLYDKHLADPIAAKKAYENALRSGTDNPTAYHLLGSLMKRTFSDYRAAKRFLEAALKLDPRHVAAHAELGWILENYCGDPVLAEEHYETAIRMDPNHAEANFCCGYSKEVHRRDYKAARRYYTVCVAADPSHVEGQYRLGKVLDEHYQQYTEAATHYEAAIQLNHKHALAHHQLGFLMMVHSSSLNQHHHHHERGKGAADFISLAKTHFLSAVEADPNLSDAHNHLGYLLWRHEHSWPAARREFLTAIQLDPNHSGAHSNLAKGLVEQEKDTAGAREHFEIAVRCDPNDVFVRTAFGEMLLDHHADTFSDVQTAFLHLEVAVAKNPCYAPARYHLARALLMLRKNPRKVKEELELALQLDPNYADAHNELGFLYEQLTHDWEKSREHYRSAIQCDPKHTTARNNLGLLLWKHDNDPLGAREQFESALTIEPHNVDVQRNYATLLREEFHDAKRSRQVLEDVLQKCPNDVSSMTLLATIMKNDVKDYRQARKLLEKARGLRPLDVSILNELGLMYVKHFKDSVMALELFEEALRLDPSNGCAQTNIDRIMSYSTRYQARKARKEASAAAAAEDEEKLQQQQHKERQQSHLPTVVAAGDIQRKRKDKITQDRTGSHRLSPSLESQRIQEKEGDEGRGPVEDDDDYQTFLKWSGFLTNEDTMSTASLTPRGRGGSASPSLCDDEIISQLEEDLDEMERTRLPSLPQTRKARTHNTRSRDR